MRPHHGKADQYASESSPGYPADLELREVTFSFQGVAALHKVSLTIRAAELVAVIGPNGAGKTTLIDCITGLRCPQAGQISYGGKDLIGATPQEIALQGIARTHQPPRLFGESTVVCNLMTARSLFTRYSLRQAFFITRAVIRDEARQLAIVEELIDLLELQPFRDSLIRDLSLSIKKRVELAMALALSPRLLILDEPFTGLTSDEAEFAAHIIQFLSSHRRLTILLVEHDLARALEIAGRIVVMDFGAKVAEGVPEFVQYHPQVVKAFFGSSAGPFFLTS